MPFAQLGLSAELTRAVADQGYTAPTPVQEQAIPLVLQGRDLRAAAQTGTGKTAAFVLPILERLKAQANSSFSPARHPVRALILTPTRELAMQIATSTEAYGKYLPLRSSVVYGGVPIDPQIKALMGGVEILVATPGRLLDHVGGRTGSTACARSRCSCSMRPIGCSTWASCRMSARSSRCCPAAARTCSSRRRSRTRSERSRRRC